MVYCVREEEVIGNMPFDHEHIEPRPFPQAGETPEALLRRLERAHALLRQRDTSKNMGLLYTPPHTLAVATLRSFLDQNPNHLGNWSTPESRPFATQSLERELVAELADLYGAASGSVEGYVTTGGSEGNLFSAWVGRKRLEQGLPPNAICLLRTELAHYSIGKAADVIGVQEFILPLSRTHWNIDPHSFSETVRRLYERGYRGFLIPLTVGYTLTGTADERSAIIEHIRTLESELPGTAYHLWVDAALSGLVTPFREGSAKPFSEPDIQTIIVDFHKFAGVPYPAGVVLYRKELRSLVERPIGYLMESDSTLLGSRSGAAAAAIWAVIHSMGKDGFAEIIKQQDAHKAFFVDGVRRICPEAEIIQDAESLSCAVVFGHRKDQRLPQDMERKYWLFSQQAAYHFRDTEEAALIYKFYFMPHMKREVVEEFLRDLEQIGTVA
jgi:glutamate/tyrosine decarboxylase-like PLP-dependent enzyme